MKVFEDRFSITKTEDGNYLISIKITDSQVTVLSVSKQDIEQLSHIINEVKK